MLKIIETLQSLSNIQKILVMVIVAAVVYVAGVAISYTIIGGLASRGSSSITSSALPSPASALAEDPNAPHTEACPLNGSMHTQQAKDFWEQRRPLAVMIENHIEARPQSGLSSADVVYEAVAEGGITRFMSLFYCNLGDIQVGPVRSARTYFIDWLSEYDALYAHVGGANTPGPADALSQIIKFDIKDLNQFSIGFPVYWRDYQRLGHPVATEHTMYSTTQKLWDIGAKRGWTATDSAGIAWNKNFTSWKFRDSGTLAGSDAKSVEVNFWESQADYKVNWDYDAAAGVYKRKNAGALHTDMDNNQQLAPKNIVIQFERETNANDGYPGNVHLLYSTLGSGKALIFQDGKVLEGKWIKPTRKSHSKFVDSNGKEIDFERGQIWIQTVPEGSKISY